MENRKKQYSYFPLLDSTRFIAFIPVFLTHCFITSNADLESALWFQQLKRSLNFGLLGLDYFFVLSSFLITRLIIEEYQLTGRFNFKLFFIRRSLRIWPLYFLMVFIGFMALSFGLLKTPLPPLISFISFTLNLYMAEHGFNFLFFLTFLWSIAVEEQFYIVWGSIIALISKPNHSILFKYFIPLFGTLLIVISICFRFIKFNEPMQLYFHTLSVSSNFGVGMVLAWLSVFSLKFNNFFKQISKAQVIIVFTLLAISFIMYIPIFSSPIATIFERLYFSLLFALVIAILCFSSFVDSWKGIFNKFDFLGKISLGLYFYHGLIIVVFSTIMRYYEIADKAWKVIFLNPVLMVLLTILCAIVSYNYFEKPILVLKKRFYPKIQSK